MSNNEDNLKRSYQKFSSIRKYDSTKHVQFSKHLPFSHSSTQIYLDFEAFVIESWRTGEHLIVWQDLVYEHNFPAIFLPQNKQNWELASIALATKKDIEKIEKENIEILIKKPTEREYFYNTSDFVELKGKYGQKIRQFHKLYPTAKILHEYPEDKILDFYYFWKNQQDRKQEIGIEGDAAFFYFCLKNLKKYSVEQVYIEHENRLIGFAFGVRHSDNNWVGLHMKNDYAYKGLNQLLRYEEVKLFKGANLFSVGTSDYDKGLAKHKQLMHPVKTRKYYYVLTGEKIKK